MKNKNLHFCFQIWTNWELTPLRLIYFNNPTETAKSIESKINDREQKEEKKEEFISYEENILVLTTEINDKIDRCPLSETYKIEAKVELSDTLNKRNQELSDIFMMSESAIQREINILNNELADFKDKLVKEKTGQDISLILIEEIGLKYNSSPDSQYQKAINFILEEACATPEENMMPIQSEFSTENIQKKLIKAGIVLPEEIQKKDPNEGEKQLSAIEFKELTTEQDYETFIKQLLKLDIEIESLGWTNSGFRLEKVQKILIDFKRKLAKTADVNILNQITFANDTTRFEYLQIMNDLLQDIEGFEQGNFFRHIKYEEISTKGLEKKDIKTAYKKYGLNTDTTVKFIEKNVSPALIYDYYAAGLLQKDFYEFIEYKIPIKQLKEFLSLFSLKEQAEYNNDITNNDVAYALGIGLEPKFIAEVIKEGLDSLSSINREKMGQYYPYLLKETGEQDDFGRTEYQYETNFFLLLQTSSIKQPDSNNPMTIKISRIDPIPLAKQYQSLGLNYQEMLIAMQVPELSVENIKVLMQKYNGLFSAEDIFEAITKKIDLDKIKILYEHVPSEEKKIYKSEGLTQFDTETVIPYLKLLTDRNTFVWGATIVYFINNSISSDQVKEFQDLGIIELGNIQELLENKINTEYLKNLIVAGIDLKEIDTGLIKDWQKENIDIAQIKSIYDLVQEDKLPKDNLWLENIKKYQSLIDSPEKKQNLIDFINAEFNLDDAFYAIENKISLEEAKKMKEEGFNIQDFEKYKKYNAHYNELSEFADIFKAKNKKMYWDDISNIIELLDLNYPREKIKKLINLDFLFDASELAKKNDDIEKYLPYREFIDIRKFMGINRLEAISYFMFFGISPETLKKYDTGQSWTDADVNRIIMTEYEKNNGENGILIFLHKLSIVTRVPLKALEKMKTDYESPEEQKKPTALVVLPKTDHNAAFEEKKDKELYASLFAGYNIYFYEVDSDKQFVDTIKSFGQDLEKKNKKIDMLLIGGHGYQGGIQFADLDVSHFPLITNDAEQLDLTDADLLQGLDQYVSKDAKIILQSCSTGKGGAGADNIASLVSKSFGGRQVFAPNKPTSIDSIRYNEQGVVEGVNYRDKDTEEHIQIKI